jgi:spore maturation protein CgeB
MNASNAGTNARDALRLAAPSKTRILWAYSAADEYTDAWHQRLLRRRRELGYDVEHFCVTPPSLKRRWLTFPDLHRLWRWGYPPLIRMYRELVDRLAGRDVLVLYNGANLHPDFAAELDVLRVYTAGDDPESTEILTRPIAPAFDVHLVNNASCLEMYWSWGLKHVHFWPLGSQVFEEEVADLTDEAVLDSGRRPVPLFLACERTSTWRKTRLERLAAEFPDAQFVGRGWPREFVPWSEMWDAYRRTQIGWNLHNSTGPINFRLYDLPAFGVMQICDNKRRLGDIFEVDTEVAGFDSIEECIDLTRHYLAHVDQQRQVALQGRKRWLRDYTPDRVWQRLVAIVDRHRDIAAGRKGDFSRARAMLERRLGRGIVARPVYSVYNAARASFWRLVAKLPQ